MRRPWLTITVSVVALTWAAVDFMLTLRAGRKKPCG